MSIYNPNFADPKRVPECELAVVTFTDGSRPESLEACKASVAADLPDNAIHYIIPVKGKAWYAHQRRDALRLAPYVCFVDDDDTVTNGAITKALMAIKATGAGVAFTDEALTDTDGTVISTREGTRTYEDANKIVSIIHHLAMINTNAIKEDLTVLHGRIQGVDWWIIKAAIKTLGAVHVPIIGYNWTQHPGTLGSNMVAFKLPDLTLSQTGPIPTYEVK